MLWRNESLTLTKYDAFPNNKQTLENEHLPLGSKPVGLNVVGNLKSFCWDAHETRLKATLRWRRKRVWVLQEYIFSILITFLLPLYMYFKDGSDKCSHQAEVYGISHLYPWCQRKGESATRLLRMEKKKGERERPVLWYRKWETERKR